MVMTWVKIILYNNNHHHNHNNYLPQLRRQRVLLTLTAWRATGAGKGSHWPRSTQRMYDYELLKHTVCNVDKTTGRKNLDCHIYRGNSESTFHYKKIVHPSEGMRVYKRRAWVR